MDFIEVFRYYLFEKTKNYEGKLRMKSNKEIKLGAILS